MQTLNCTLERMIAAADGRYFDVPELQVIEGYAQSYAQRLRSYEQLRDNSDKLVMQSLRKLSVAYPDLVRQHGNRCKYDMTEVLRYVAVSVLRDDETFFKEQVWSWLDTILLAHRHTAACSVAYHALRDVIEAALPTSAARLICPYLDCVIRSLDAHA